MDTLNTLPDWASGYRLAIVALAVLCLMVLIQTVLGVIFGMIVGREEPGGKYVGGYDEFGFRTLRTHLNSTETLAVFAISLLLALFAKVSPEWVNGLAILYVATRILYWILYYAGVGRNKGGPRTIIFVAGWATNVVLATLALFSLLI